MTYSTVLDVFLQDLRTYCVNLEHAAKTMRECIDEFYDNNQRTGDYEKK